MSHRYDTLLVTRHGFRLDVVLHRPAVKNAMSRVMVEELHGLFADAGKGIRVITLSGAGNAFCAGGDIKDMAALRAAAADSGDQAFTDFNRAFGAMLQRSQACPAAVIACVDGPAMGGGFGLAAAADITLATKNARFSMPEVRLGIAPAQIAPFVVQRIGLAKARELALTGRPLSGEEAFVAGLVNAVFDDAEAMQAGLGTWLQDIQQAAPGALAATKALLFAAQNGPDDAVLDKAAQDFARLSQGEEAMEGGMAFMQKRAPAWASGDKQDD